MLVNHHERGCDILGVAERHRHRQLTFDPSPALLRSAGSG
jgi:hypothetical protein